MCHDFLLYFFALSLLCRFYLQYLSGKQFSVFAILIYSPDAVIVEVL